MHAVRLDIQVFCALYIKQRAENQGQQSRSILDTEMVQLRTELEQLRARSDAERATYMTALEEKDKEIAAEVEDKVSYDTNRCHIDLLCLEV